MKPLVSLPTRSAPSIITATLASFAIAASTASAAFIYHDTASTTGGFLTNYEITNLKNSGHTVSTALEDASLVRQSYATASPPTGGFPITLTLGFSSAVSIDKFYLWNHTEGNASGATANGVKNFTLTFFDAPTLGNQIGSAFSGIGTVASANGAGMNPAQTFDFGSTRAGVRRVEFSISSKESGFTTGFVAMREVGFNQIPEPSSAILGGLGLLALLRRRR